MNETFVLCNDSENESYNYSKCSKEELFNHLTTLVNQRKLLRDRYCNSAVLSKHDYQTLKLTNSRILRIQQVLERIRNQEVFETSKNQKLRSNTKESALNPVTIVLVTIINAFIFYLLTMF